MMKKTIYLFVFSFFFTFSMAPAMAQGKEAVAIYGHGNSKCSEYNQYRFKNGGNIVKNYQVWLNGFLSSYNTFVSPSGDAAKGMRSDDMMLWIEDFCRLNPDAYFQRATIELLRAIESNQF